MTGKKKLLAGIVGALLAGNSPRSNPPLHAACSEGGGARSAAQPLRPCQSVTTDETTYSRSASPAWSPCPFPWPAWWSAAGRARAGRPAGAYPGQCYLPRGSGRRRAPASDFVAETEITLISPTELYFLGRRPGSMNLILQGPMAAAWSRTSS